MQDITKIYVSQELFAPAESLAFDGEYSLQKLNIGPDCYEFSEPIRVSGRLSNVGDALLVTGSAEGIAKTCCSRCLEQTEYDLCGQLEGYFILKQDAVAPDDMEGDEFDYLPEDNIIDLEPIILAALMVDAPAQPLCSSECKGLCPVCGANLNTDTNHTNHETESPRETSHNPFDVLKDYHFDPK